MSPSDIIISLGLYAAAAFRMLPSSNKILLSLQKLKYSKSAIELISKEIGVVERRSDLKSQSIIINLN